MSDEKTLLHNYLRATRSHVLGIVEGLDADALRRPVLPTGWSCVAMLNHLTVDIEQFWFRAVVAAEPSIVSYHENDYVDAWQMPADVDPDAVLDDYRQACDRSDAIIEATPLDAAPAWWPGELFGEWRLDDLRDLLLHVITETACHAGHLDAARELIDGRTWLVLT